MVRGDFFEGRMDWHEVITAFHRMQSQAMSLNDHFAQLTTQINSLKLHRDNLQSQLFSYSSSTPDSTSLLSTVQHHMEQLFTTKATFSEMRLTLNSEGQEQLLEKETRKAVKVAITMVMLGQETMLKCGNYLTFIGRQVGGLDERITAALGSVKLIPDPEKVMKPGKKGAGVVLTSPHSLLRDVLHSVFPSKLPLSPTS